MQKITLGIIGGGQLGSMLANAARKIEIKTIVFCDDMNAPAQKFSDEFIYGKYNDQNKINEFINKVDVITFEFENIPFKTLNEINKKKPVFPKPSINRIIQHRLAEKDFINKLNIKTTKYVAIENKSEIGTVEDLLPGLLKTTTLGYDGKGQYLINSMEELESIKIDFSKGYILEKMIKLKKEISIIITRFNNQKYEIYEPFENTHEDQILKQSSIPANISDKILNQSIKWATLIAEELKYIGTLCVEFFIDRNENLYVNEIAPRVHNSGHLTINAYNISQFENHIRAVCGLEQIPLKKICNAKMINLIGDQITIYRNKKLKDGEFFFDYLKTEIKKKRKMGHLIILKKIV
ncbi:5-(carboxyamino)imidazole ribonucleotide synthase [Candidatus Pelagibacter sp.]|nr:5-(carboxyamino)imidazole ribonucleotide synthase [Candidatus Pelagibacter sp.]